MNWWHLVAYFFGGVFAVNAIPHTVSGVTGRAFQSPFAKPPGKGLSSSRVNVLWGGFNVVVAYVLVLRVGDFDLRALADAGALGLGGLLAALLLAGIFGPLHGGATPPG